MSVRKTTPDKTHNFLWHMFQIHVAQPLGTVHYLPLLFLLITSFLRNYYGEPDPRIYCKSHHSQQRAE